MNCVEVKLPKFKTWMKRLLIIDEHFHSRYSVFRPRNEKWDCRIASRLGEIPKCDFAAVLFFKFCKRLCSFYFLIVSRALCTFASRCSFNDSWGGFYGFGRDYFSHRREWVFFKISKVHANLSERHRESAEMKILGNEKAVHGNQQAVVALDTKTKTLPI